MIEKVQFLVEKMLGMHRKKLIGNRLFFSEVRYGTLFVNFLLNQNLAECEKLPLYYY